MLGRGKTRQEMVSLDFKRLCYFLSGLCDPSTQGQS